MIPEVVRRIDGDVLVRPDVVLGIAGDHVAAGAGRRPTAEIASGGVELESDLVTSHLLVLGLPPADDCAYATPAPLWLTMRLPAITWFVVFDDT